MLVKGDRIDLDVDVRGEDLVPAVDVGDDGAAAIEGARAAERVGEGGVWGEVGFDGGLLC